MGHTFTIHDRPWKRSSTAKKRRSRSKEFHLARKHRREVHNPSPDEPDQDATKEVTQWQGHQLVTR